MIKETTPYKVTFEEEQHIKLLANTHGITIPWTPEGKIDPVFVIGLRIGGLLGKAIGMGASEEQINELLEPVNKVLGNKYSVKAHEDR